MPLTVGVHIERPIELIDRRATEASMKDGERPTHHFLT